MYARVIKFTFVNQFSKEATTSLLNNLVTKKGFSQGMIFRVTIDTSETQRYSVTVWPDKQGSDKTWKSFAENVLSQIKSAGMSERFNDSVTDLQDEIKSYKEYNVTFLNELR